VEKLTRCSVSQMPLISNKPNSPSKIKRKSSEDVENVNQSSTASIYQHKKSEKANEIQ